MANCIQCGRKLPGLAFGKKLCQWCVQNEAAKRGELSDDAKQVVLPAPWVRRRESSISLTKVLFGANVAVFIAMVAASGSMDAFPGDILGHFGANFGPYTLSGQWWRLLTYMFVHADIWHIAFNMWCLWSLGSLCESLYGGWTFGAIYLITGVAGGLASVAWHPLIPSVGASGAIFGLAGALIASLYLGEFNLPSGVIQANLKSVLFFVGFNILFGISAIGDIFGVHVDNACHIGGLLSGLIVGALIALVAPQEDKPLSRIGILLFVVFLLLGCTVGVSRWRGNGMGLGSATTTQRSLDQLSAQLQKTIRQNPNDASAHYALAHVYFNKRQIPEAEAELKRVLELRPQDERARMDLGAAYLSRGQAQEAQQEFAKLIAQDSNDANAHIGLGMALADQDNHEAAVNEFKTALQLAPEARDVYYKLGVSQAQLKEYDNAIASFTKERERSGDAADLENALADAYQAKGLQQEAQSARNRATQLRSSDND